MSNVMSEELQRIRAAQEATRHLPVVIPKFKSEGRQQRYESLQQLMLARAEEIKKFPQFWLKAFRGHPELEGYLTNQNSKLFFYLDSLEVEEVHTVTKEISIKFNFTANPYIHDPQLHKRYTIAENSGELTMDSSIIHWKDNCADEHKPLLDGMKKEFSSEERSLLKWINEKKEDNFLQTVDHIFDIITEDLWDNPVKYFEATTNGSIEIQQGQEARYSKASYETLVSIRDTLFNSMIENKSKLDSYRQLYVCIGSSGSLAAIMIATWAAIPSVNIAGFYSLATISAVGLALSSAAAVASRAFPGNNRVFKFIKVATPISALLTIVCMFVASYLIIKVQKHGFLAIMAAALAMYLLPLTLFYCWERKKLERARANRWCS